jgi:hypothetical protein
MFYFAGQGRSEMLWPFSGELRFIATVGGAWWLADHGALQFRRSRIQV